MIVVLGLYRTIHLSKKHVFQIKSLRKFHFSKKCLLGAETKRRTFKDVEDRLNAAKLKESKPSSGLFLLVLPLTAFGLGIWQIFRKIEKEALISNLEVKTKREPVLLPANLEELKSMEYCPVKVRGKFLHSREIYLGPRSLLSKRQYESSGLLSQPSQSGYHIVTPFQLADRNLTILVNRGWVPFDKLNPKNRLEGQISNEIELVGIIRLNERKPPLGVKNVPEKNNWSYRDLYKMAEFANTDPIFIDAVESSSVPGGPIGGQTRISLRNEHLSYIITWFALGIITGGIWYSKYRRNLWKHAHPQSAT